LQFQLYNKLSSVGLNQMSHKVEINKDGKQRKLKYKMVFPLSIGNPDIIVQKKLSTIGQLLQASLQFKLEIHQWME